MGYLIDAPPVRATSSKMPELVVEWLPTAGPSAPDGDWCDITEYVTQGRTVRGRQYELDAFQAGTCSITLQSFTRLFDPENTAGPFYPYLNPMRQVRVSAVWSGTRYPIWRGYVTDWGQTHEQDKLFVTTITARDGFEPLEQYKLPSSAWALEIIRDNPSAWFRLGESDTARMTDNSPNGNYGVYDNCQQGAQGLVVNDSDGAVAFAHSLEERAVIQNPNLITGYPFTVSFMFKIDNTMPSGTKTILVGWPNIPKLSIGYVLIYISETSATIQEGGVVVNVFDGTNTRLVGTRLRYTDNIPHHCAVVCASASSFTIYIDGVAVPQGTGTAGTGAPAFLSQPPSNWTIGNEPDLQGGDFGFGTNADGLGVTSQDVHRGTLDEFCVWNGTAVDSTRIAAHALAAKTGWDGDDTGTRVSRFLDRIDWPSTLRDVDAGISILGAASWSAGASALSVLQAWADTEVGQFVMGTNGELVWRSRHFPLLDASATTSQATFSDAHGSGLKFDDVDLPRDATLIRNPVSAGRRDGVAVTVKDQTLIDTKYGPRSWTAPNTEDQKDSAVRDRALWLLARYKEQGTRLAKMELTPTQDATNLFPQALGRVLGDRITVKRTPLGIGSEISVDQILEGVEHAFTPFTWQTIFRGSPVDPNVGDYLILDDATYGVLDTAELAY